MKSTLSQCRDDETTNDHKAALELLHGLVLRGRVIVGDAMVCQRDLCRQVVDSGGDSSTTFLAALRNAALNRLRLTECDKVTATLRSFALDPLRLFTQLGYQNETMDLVQCPMRIGPAS